MFVNKKLDYYIDEENNYAIDINIKWHSTKNILSVSSSTVSNDGFLSFFTNKV